MEGWTMILVRSERGDEYLKEAAAAGVLELRDAEQEPKALEVMMRLATKQRERVKPGDPHWQTRFPTIEIRKQFEAENA